MRTTGQEGGIPVLHEYVVDWLTGVLMRGELGPGHRVDPGTIGRDLGISHIPVREALQVLAGEGRLDWIPRRGFFIPELDAERLEAVYHWLRIIETEGYRLALPSVTPADAGLMAELCSELEDARVRDDLVAYRKAHRRFHFQPLIHQPGRLPVRFLEYLWDQADRFAAPYLRTDVEITRLQGQHLQLVDAFRAADIEQVLTIMSDHRHLTMSYTLVRNAGIPESPNPPGKMGPSAPGRSVQKRINRDAR